VRNTKNFTLFSFIQRNEKGKPLSAVEAAESQDAESSCHVVVHPVSMRPFSALEYADRNHGNALNDGERHGVQLQDNNKKDDRI